MESQKIMSSLDNATIQTSTFRTRNWVEINDESRGKNVNSNIIFETSMIRLDFYDYSDAYILSSGTITINGERDDAAAKRADERNEGVIFGNYAPFPECVSSINNTQINHAKDRCYDANV